MTEAAIIVPIPAVKSLAPDRTEKMIGWAALLLLAVVATAILRGSGQWGQTPPLVWAHLATMLLALGLTPVILWNRRGTQRHRQLGYVWVASLAATALITFDIRLSNRGSFSLVHILSAWTLIQLPIIVWSARTRNHSRHRQSVRGMAIGALLIAGFFTFPFGRLLGQWLMG